MNQFTFEPGKHVKHKLGTQTMIVIEYEEVSGFIRLGSFIEEDRYEQPSYTGNVLCGWVDSKNMPQRAYFKESELEEVH